MLPPLQTTEPQNRRRRMRESDSTIIWLGNWDHLMKRQGLFKVGMSRVSGKSALTLLMLRSFLCPYTFGKTERMQTIFRHCFGSRMTFPTMNKPCMKRTPSYASVVTPSGATSSAARCQFGAHPICTLGGAPLVASHGEVRGIILLDILSVARDGAMISRADAA